MKKIIASVSLVAILAANTAFAVDIGSVTGGATNNNVNWDGNFGGTNNATGNSTVNVNATVVPILTMTIGDSSLALGNLSTTEFKAKSTTVSVSTNANGGAIVNMKVNGLKDSVNNKEIGQNKITDANGTTTGNDFYQYAVDDNNAIIDEATFLAAETTPSDFASTADTTGVNVVTLPQVGAMTKNVGVGAKIATTTEAGSYSDVITFTVTATF